MDHRIIRIDGVVDRIGISRSTLYRLVKHGKFLRQLALGPNSVGWLQADVAAWIEARSIAAASSPSAVDAVEAAVDKNSAVGGA